MANKVSVGIIGGAGYTAGELIRILLQHPFAELTAIHSKSNAGNFIYQVHQDLIGETDLKFTGDLPAEIDVLFLCLGHGESKKFLAENSFADSVKIIDLANDFRLSAHSASGNRNFVYGLPELQREAIRNANNIANPGCFATAIQLGLLPLAKAGLLHDVYTTGITGSTGAGQSLAPTSHFSWRANNIQAYKTLTHQHNAEILQSINSLQAAAPLTKDHFSFVPWRGDFTRGIFISSQLNCEETIENLNALYNDFYNVHPFTTVTTDAVYLKQVVNTNKCVIQLEKVGSKLVIHSVIDNLVKGASGQAIQNMNLIFGFEETAGLKLKASYF
ncbi:MAG: N-acetyl-gamma-glutamyl-phosphate reductase [Bacteroidetes bacterium]|nr:N-acetyl-gamma-glutamyl-phosphate reductase [Bacteroidota bacterium]